MKKRVFSTILAFLIGVSAAPEARAGFFRDVPEGHWAREYIESAAQNGYIEGVGDGSFKPFGEVTFAEFAAMTARALFREELAGYQGPEEPWYAPYVSVCVDKNVFLGADFALGRDENRSVTRAELALMSANALKSAGAPMPETTELEALESRIPDLQLYTPDEIAAIRYVYVTGVMNGSGDTGLFEGRDAMDRAQAAAVLMRVSGVERVSPGAGIDESAAYDSMIAMKSRYPEGTKWTGENSYAWRGGIFNVGYGCAGFAFLLSDAAFGELPARKIDDVRLENVRVGDILRINGNTHSVIVLEKTSDGVVVAEGNL